MRHNTFEKRVRQYIAAHAIFRDDAPVVVALSGGADSVALLAVLTALGYDCVAAHCNFHLRGAESRRDMLHARDIAAALDVNLYVKDFDVPARMAATGESLEMACRALRYDWFLSLLDRERAQAIAVGHHREDQAETFLLNALRGTGITGLAAMAPHNGYVARPLLDCTRRDIEEYLQERGLTFITDSSNSDNRFRRNSLRNRVIPTMQEHFPDAIDTLHATASHVADNLALYTYAVRQLASRFRDAETGVIDVGGMKSTLSPRIAKTLLFEMLKEAGFNATHVTNMIESREGTATFRAGDTVAELSRGLLTLRGATSAMADHAVAVSLSRDIVEPIAIAISRHHITAFNPTRDSATAYFDERILDGSPAFEMRHWRRGDRMTPFGMTASKLLSDIFAQAHLSPAQKREAWLLTRNGEIIWAVGIRPSALFQVTPATKHFLRLSL